MSNLAILLGAEVNTELDHARAIAQGLPEDAEPFADPRDTRNLDDHQKHAIDQAQDTRRDKPTTGATPSSTPSAVCAYSASPATTVVIRCVSESRTPARAKRLGAWRGQPGLRVPPQGSNRLSAEENDGSGNAVATESKTRCLLGGVRRVRRMAVQADVTLTLVPVVLWAAMIFVPAVIPVGSRRRSAHSALAGPGDDKPAGYENPTPDDVTGHTAL